jgi:hypothetical protein
MKRNQFLLLVMLVLLCLILVACGASSSSSNTLASPSGTTDSKSGTSLSKINVLLVGTLKLENTDQALTADEAGQLLPLWQAYRSLSTSQTAAQAEVDGLLKQIESAMTSEQMNAINAMNLTSTDMMNLMQTMGVGMGPQGTPDPNSTPGFYTQGDGFPSGDFPSGSTGSQSGGPSGGNMPPGGMLSGGGPPSGGGGGAVIVGGGDAGSAAGLGGGPVTQGTQDPSMQATAQARFSTQANKVNTMLLDVLINKLQAKTTQ